MRMASFLSGFGGGYLKAKDKTAQDERQARLDAQATELHNARMTDIGDAQAERQRERDYRGAMESALSAGKTDTGFQVTDAAGSNAFTKDKDAAGVLADMAGTLNGGASIGSATRVLTGMQGAIQRGTIPGQQVFTDPAKAQDFAKTMTMTDYTKLKARQDVAEQYAKLDVADDMRDKLEKLAQKGVFQAYQHLDAGNAEDALKVLQNANPNLVPGNATFKQVDVPDMFDRSKTVKGWSLVAPGAEGQSERVMVGDFRDAVFGYLSPEKQFDLKHKVSETDLARRKTEVAEKNAETQEKRWDAWIAGNGRAGGGGAGGGGTRGGRAGGGAVEFDPYQGFDPKNAQSAATDLVDAAIERGGKPVSAQERAQLISDQVFKLRDAYVARNAARHRAIAFLAEARRAETPEQVETLRQRAKADGYTDNEMATLDSRFTPQQVAQKVANPFARNQSAATSPVPAAKPAIKPVEPQGRLEFQQFQQALQKGYQAASRGNAVFGPGEILYVNPKTGDRKWASQLFTQ